MNRKKYLRLYVVVLFLLFLHFAVALRFSEPFPAFIFPAFDKNQKMKDTCRLPVTYLYAIDSQGNKLILDQKNELGPGRMNNALSVVNTISKNEKIISEQLQHNDSGKYSEKLSAMISRRETFVSLINETLRKNHPQKEFTSLLIEQGILRYDMKEQRPLPELDQKVTTLIQLQ